MGDYLLYFQQMKKEQQFFDCELETDDGHRFPVHQLVLSLAADYFKNLFNNPEVNQKRIEGGKEIYHIEGVTSEKLGVIVDYCYGGQINISLSNVKELLVLAERFLIQKIVLQCCEWLEKNVCPANCVGYLRIATNYKNGPLSTTAKNCLLQNFTEIVSLRDEFGTLTILELVTLLKDDDLGISDEMICVDAIIQWIHYDVSNRKLYLTDLLKCVRLKLLNIDQLATKIRRSLMFEFLSGYCDQCLSLINECVKNTPTDVDGSNYFSRPRIPYEIPFVIGGWTSGYFTNTMETFDVRAKCWSYIDNIDPTARAYHRLETLRGCIFMLGGYDGTRYFNTVRCYDPVLKIWMDKAPMFHFRCYVSSCVLDDLLYVLGGFDGRVRLNSAERYEYDSNQWSIISPMTRHRSDASAAAFKGKVYVVGGFNGEDVLNSAEFYDPQSDVWSYIAPLNSPRSGTSVVTFSNNLYVFGGFNGFTRLSSGEKYDSYYNRWLPITNMSTARSNFAAVVLEKSIYVIGGYDGNTTISVVECYNPDTNSWTDAPRMCMSRSALSACVLKNLPNRREYSYLGRFPPST